MKVGTLFLIAVTVFMFVAAIATRKCGGINHADFAIDGRFDNVVFAVDTTPGSVKSIPVKTEPHGLTVWPQPGRYSLRHTGNSR